jgi:1,2-diacylglycerol 3-beta-galactosyltransferase
MAKSMLILTCDSGGGHRSVTDAIVGAVDRLFPDKYRCHLADIMADGFPFPLNKAGRFYGPVVNRLPRSWGVLWHATNGRNRSPLVLRLVAPLAFNRLARLLRTAKPDIVVSTHPWANHIPAWLIQRLDSSLPLVTVVTDPINIHHWWLYPAVDLCLVPTDQARQKALQAGFAPSKVQVVGMPVSLGFADDAPDKAALRKKLGLAPDRVTVLVVGGGDGMGNVFPVARTAAQSGLDIQLVIVTGRNDGLKTKLETAPWEVPTHVLGFVDNMPELMHSADLLVTKAGPSTIAEALSCGLPMLITGALRGQEEGNSAWVADTGAAILTQTPQELVAALQDLSRNGNGRLRRMGQRAREAARPDAALQAARLIDRIASGSA